MSVKHVVLYDPHNKGRLQLAVGELATDALVGHLTAKGIAVIPFEDHLKGIHPLAGWLYIPCGRGAVIPTKPDRVLAATFYVTPQANARLNWRARVRFDGHEPNGCLRISPDSSQVGANQAPISIDTHATCFMDGLELDVDGCAVVGGWAPLRAAQDQYVGVCLTGSAFNATVLWAAVSQSG